MEAFIHGRAHPQETYHETMVIDPESFHGSLRRLYGGKILKTQLDQFHRTGAFRAFDLKWQDVYNVRRMRGARVSTDGYPPSIFWESDVAKWMEAVCYFLNSEDGRRSPYAADFKGCLDQLIPQIIQAQQPDGYLNIYFTVVDPEGKFMNLRDMHEMYNAGHLLEASLAHHHYDGSTTFLNCMIKYVDLFIHKFGPNDGQLHGYPGHEELELAMLRLYSRTSDPRHLEFALYLLEARGVRWQDQGGDSYFVWEAKCRRKDTTVRQKILPSVEDMRFNQSHLPLHQQKTIIGHAVRALYLTTAAADMGGLFLEDAERLMADVIDRKMYVTGGVGTNIRTEGFEDWPYFLPQSLSEGGGYGETCASIACMMTCERILSHRLDEKYRSVLERCWYNGVLGGGSLDGSSFAYTNRLATCGTETAIREPWYETCCCPPNLARTVGMIGGYMWHVKTSLEKKVIQLDVLLFVSATRHIDMPGGLHAEVKLVSGLPWRGHSEINLSAPSGWTWAVAIPHPEYASNYSMSPSGLLGGSGFMHVELPASSTLSIDFDLPIRKLGSHPRSGQDTLTITRGPIVYTVESCDNREIDALYPHFEGVGLREDANFNEENAKICDVEVIMLHSKQSAYVVDQLNHPSPIIAVQLGQPGDAGTMVRTGESGRVRAVKDIIDPRPSGSVDIFR